MSNSETSVPQASSLGSTTAVTCNITPLFSILIYALTFTCALHPATLYNFIYSRETVLYEAKFGFLGSFNLLTVYFNIPTVIWAS